MLIEHLGEARRKLLASFEDLSDLQLNTRAGTDGCSIAEVVHRLYRSEMKLAMLALDSLSMRGGPVAEKDLSVLEGEVRRNCTRPPKLNNIFTKGELISLLEVSRFGHLQLLFNETHVSALAEKSLEHPVYGAISLKNLIDTIWLDERHHARRIEEIKASLRAGHGNRRGED